MLGLCALSNGCTASIGDPIGSGSGGPGSGPGGSGGPGTGSGPGGPCQATTPPRIWRLSDEQFVNAVSDLLPGVTVPAVATPGRTVGEFINMAERYPVTGALASNLRTSAKTVAAASVKDLAGLLKCQTGQAQDACVGAFVDRFAPRAFRRPIDATERQALLAVYALGAKTTPADGVRLVLEAVLQSPSFLYRTELGAGAMAGQATALNAYELATAVSFLLIDSIPDDELWRTAQDGSLSNADVFTQQVDRLLARQRGHRTAGDGVSRIRRGSASEHVPGVVAVPRRAGLEGGHARRPGELAHHLRRQSPRRALRRSLHRNDRVRRSDVAGHRAGGHSHPGGRIGQQVARPSHRHPGQVRAKGSFLPGHSPP